MCTRFSTSGFHAFLLLAMSMVMMQDVTVLAQPIDRDNAALWYERAIEAFHKIPEADRKSVIEYMRDPQGSPPIEIRNVVRRASEAFNHLQRGSAQEYHDLGLDYSQGWELLLPHLQPLRDLSRFAQADVMIQIESGNIQGATDRMATMYRLSHHMISDRTLISSLVGQSIFSGTDTLVQQALDRATLGPLESRALLRAMQAMDPSDPFDYVEAIIMEQTIGVECIGKKFDDPEERMNAHEQFDWLTNDAEDAIALAQMTNEGFQADLQGYDLAMGQIVEIFMMDDKVQARAMLDELEKELLSGEMGLLATIMVPSLSKLFDRKIAAEKMVADRMAVLEGLVEGTILPKEEANAALLYLQGIATIESEWDEGQLTRLRELDAHPERPIDDEFDSLLQASAGIIDVFREGSLKRRCDFTLYRKRPAGSLTPFYAAGLRDAYRLLQIDALHHFRKGQFDEVVDRLAIGYRMSGHLSSDDPLAITLVAHEGFTRASPLTMALSARDDFSDVQRFQLFDAIDSIPLRDPFGFIISALKTREALARELIQKSPALESGSYPSLFKHVTRWQGDQLIYLQVIFDTLQRAGRSDGTTNDSELRRLDDVFSLNDLEVTRNHVTMIAPMIARGDINFFGPRSIPMIANYRERQRVARSDLRRLLSRLRPTFEKEPEATEERR